VHNINGQPINSGSIIQGILTGPYYQFWYLYLLVGLYLLTPILRVVMAQADRVLIKYLLVLWLLGTFILPFIYLLTPYQLDSNVLQFTGYAGYFILGAFLVTVQIRRLWLAILTGLGVALTAIGTYVLAATVGGKEMYWFQLYFSPTLILASAALFMLLMTVQKPFGVHSPPILTPSIQPSPNLMSPENHSEAVSKTSGQSKGRKLLAVISANTLGLFLLHPMVLDALQKGYFGFTINGNTLNSVASVPLNTAIVLFVSLGILLALKRIPGLKKLIG